MQILIVEDDEHIARVLERGLKQEKYLVDLAHDGKEGAYKFAINTYDLVILDLMLPKMNGIEVCKKMREKSTATPILVLTAKDDVKAKVEVLDAGADDYITKPFSFIELNARIRALLRRGNKSTPTILKIADVSMDPATKVVMRGNKRIYLTTREYALLEYLLHNQNRVVTKSELIDHVWDYNYDGFSNVVETYIRYVRSKLRAGKNSAPELIKTIRGMGYMIENDHV